MTRRSSIAIGLLATLAAALTAPLEVPVRAAVALSAVAPLGASAGINVQITGTGFDPVASNNTVTLTPQSGAAVSLVAESITVLDAAKGLRRIGITVPAGLPIGSAAILVRNRTTNESAGGKALHIVQITLPQTKSAVRGATQVPVRVDGSSNVQFVAGRTTPTFGAGITVTSTQVLSATSLIATISVSATTSLGPRTVTIVTSTQTMALGGGLTVSEVNRPPSITSPAVTSAAEGSPYAYQVTATDPDGDAITFRLVSAPAGMAIAAGLIAWTPGSGQTGSQSVVVEAMDGRGGTAQQSFQITVAAVPQLQSIDVQPALVRLSPPGATQALTVTGLFTNGATIDLTGTAAGTTYESSDPAVALVATDGTVTAVARGSAVITVRNGSLSDTVVVVVTTANIPPVADAGPDQTVFVGTDVTLDGGASRDVDGDALTYRWSLTTLPAASTTPIVGANEVRPTFRVDVPGIYVARLIVNDGTTDSAPDTITVSTRNSPPVADAGPDQTAPVLATVTLDGSASRDVDGNALTYRWTLMERPGTSTASLTGETQVRPTIVVDAAGTYVIRLIVNDGSVDSAPDTIAISSSNSPPVADAGPDQTVLVGSQVPLDGTASRDVDGNELFYFWTLTVRPVGSAAAIDGLGVRRTFVADVAGTYVAQLIVNDGQVDSAPNTVVITTLNAPPVANAGLDQTVSVGANVQLEGRDSSDADRNALTFRWALTTRPPGSAAALDDATSPTPRFVADRAGTYVAQLIVNDGSVDSAPDLVTVSTDNSRPVANAGADQQVAPGTVVQLDGRASADADGSVLTFRWSFTARPTLSTAALSDPTSPQPSFTADRPGDYVAQLIVSDGTMDSGPDTVLVSTANTVPVANAGPDQSVATGATVQLDGSVSFDPDSTSLTYSWTFLSRPAGSAASLSDPSRVMPTFTADVDGDYVAQLTVDDGTQPGALDTVVVTATAPADLSFRALPIDAPPALGDPVTVWFYLRNNGPSPATGVTASIPTPAGLRHSQYAAAAGTFDGSTWRIPNPIPSGTEYWIILTYFVDTAGTKNLTARVATSDQADPSPANDSATLSFTPNTDADVRASFLFPPSGTVAPGSSAGPFGIWLRIQTSGPAPATGVVINFTPPSGYTVTGTSLGANAYPGDYHPSTGVWNVGTLRPGQVADLMLAAIVNPTGSTALVGSVTAVSPDPDLSNNLTMAPPINRPPTVHAGPNRAVPDLVAETLDGTAASDAEGDALTYQWAFVQRPFGSFATIENPTAAMTRFVPDRGGVYILGLTVSDGRGGIATSTVTITAQAVNHAPVIRSAPVTTGGVGQAYQYVVRATDATAGETLVFSLPVAPAGMAIDPIAGVISWTPAANQSGPQSVTVRVQDSIGLSATQSYAVQVSSGANQAPVAIDDAYEARVGESAGVAAPGVLRNDTDASPLTATLVTAPVNGTVALSADGSFIYTPHTQQSGADLVTGRINLAHRLPGVVVSGGEAPWASVDENPATYNLPFYIGAGEVFQVVLPVDATVFAIELARNLNSAAAPPEGSLQMLDAAGTELYSSGTVVLHPTVGLNGRLEFPRGLPGVRRVRFTMMNGTFSEFRVIGTVPAFRSAQVEPNLTQLRPVTIRASNTNTPERVVDGTYKTAWYASSFNANEFIEIEFPSDVTVSAIRGDHHRGSGGFDSSQGYSCSGVFTLRAADGSVLFDSGVVNHPSSRPNTNLSAPNPFDIPVANQAGVRILRYQLSGCAPSSFYYPGFSEIEVIGTSSSDAPAFQIGRRLQSLMNHEVHSTPIVVNLTDDNGDGRIDTRDIPDIVVPVEGQADQRTGDIRAVSGDDGRGLFTAGGPNLVSPWSEIAAGDIDGDGLPEIVAVHADGRHVIAFEHTGELKWISDETAMPTFDLGGTLLTTGAVSLANLDGVGPPEIIVGATVFDANGRLLGRGDALGGTTGGAGKRSAISAVADIDLDGTPELVAGPTAYRLSNGALTRVWGRTDRPDGYIALGNFDDDPQAEIVVVADGAVYMLNHDGTDAEVWNAPSHAAVPLPGGGQGGAPLVADVDGDGRPEIGVAGSRFLTLFGRDGAVRWQAVVTDQTSGSTGSVAFDLDGDGTVEIVYRDEFFLHVYRGADGAQLARMPVGSSTWSETPTVADVDNDGHADIVVSSDQYQQNPTFDRGIIVFNDWANLWTRTRRIWNQHAYHVTNVNEDATIPLVESPHWLVSGLNGFRTNRFVPGESPDSADSFTYMASDGVLQSNVATAHISVRPVNGAPTFTSSPLARAARGVVYTYAARATDPDAGDILTYSLPTAPAGMTVDAASGLLRWTPSTAQLGAHQVVVKAADVRGLFALQFFTVDVAEPASVPDVVGQAQAAAHAAITAATLTIGAVSARHSPTVPSGAVISQSPAGGTLVAIGSAVGLVVSTGPAPAGTVPDVVGQTQTSAAADIVAAQFVVGAIGQSYSTSVPAGVVLSQSPAAGTTADLASAIALGVSAGPPPGTLDIDGDGYTGDRGDCNDTNASINPGAFDVPGDGIDQNCNGVDSVAGDATLPIALLVTPADLAEVTMPTDIVGTVADTNFLRYTVQLAEVDATTFTTIGSGSVAVTSGVVGRLDPTLLENGLYRVRLIAEDVNGQTAVDERVYRVSGESKVGTFGLSFVDLRVPMQGVPITIVRSYDSRVKTGRDFGIGWRLQVSAGKLRHNRPPGQGWRIQDRPFLGEALPCLGGALETRSHLTEVRLSDREYYTFALAVDNGNLGITGACEGVASFRYRSGTLPGATLGILDGTSVIYLRDGDDTLLDMNDWLEGTPRVYEPRRVRLTTIDGRRIDLDLNAGVTRIEDNNANALSITPAGILHTSGRSIAFTRDLHGRLIRITDPMGRTLDYEYTGEDLTTFTDQAGNITTFTYDSRHNLREMHDPLGNRAVLAEYDAAGRLIAVTDAKGHRTVFAHDISGHEEIVTDAMGRPTRFVYDDRGNVLSQEKTVTIDGVSVLSRTERQYDTANNETRVIDPDGVRAEGVYAGANLLEDVTDPGGLALRTLRTYDARGEVLTMTNPAGDVMSFGYDGRGNLTTLTDGGGAATALSYDAAGRPTLAVDASGSRRQLTYDANGHTIRDEQLDATGTVLTRVDFTHDPNGNVVTRSERRTLSGIASLVTTRFTYDALNRLVATTDALGGVARTEYNAVGRPNATIDALGRRTSVTYDEVGAMVRTDFPDGTFETLTYDAVGNVASTTDRAGRTTTYEYDEIRRRVRVVRPDGTSTRTAYSSGGRAMATIDARGNRTDHEYDAAGRRTRTVLPAVRNAVTGATERPAVSYEYDAAGRIAAVVDANGRRTSFTYDGMGRLLRRTFADGTDRENVYDALGRVIEQRDEVDRVTRFGYDALGRLTRVTDALGGLTRYTYDETGRMRAQTDALGRTTSYQPDALGRQVVRRLPGGGVETHSYDAVGNLVAETDFNGSTVSMGYDAMNRLVRRSDPGGVDVTFTYTPTGQRATATDARGTTTWAYNVTDQLVRVTHPAGEVIDYTYDADRHMRRLQTTGALIDYERDALGRVVAVDAIVDNQTIGQSRYGYDPTGNIVEQTRPNGVTTRLTYDVRNRLTDLVHVSGGTTIGSFAYELSSTGRRTRVSELGGGVVRYGYDALDRLVSEVREGSLAVAYEYDAVGNRTRMIRDGAPTSYAYDIDDRLLSAGASSFTYDANGNVVSRTLGGATTRYDWDANGRLVRANGPGGVTEFTYDVDGNRVARQSGGDVTRFLVDDNNPTGLPQVVEERGGTGDLRAQYTFGASRLSATRAGATAFYQADGLGSTRLLTNAAGAVTDQYQHDAFGILTSQTGSTANPYLFAGEQFEPALGQYNLRARNYDPATGGFTSRDAVLGNPADPRSQHPYVYAHGDPVNTTDPTGLFTLMEITTALGIQDVLKAVDLGRTAVQYCALTGKLEVAQEALFWGQFAIAGPLLAQELFGTNPSDAKVEFTFSAKRYLNVLKSPEKIVEAKATFELARGGDRTLGVELKREDGLTFGGSFVLNDISKSKFAVAAGPVSFSFGSGSGPEFGFEKSIDIFKVDRCAVDLVKCSLKLGAKISLKGPEVSADWILESLGILKFTYPMIPQ